MNQENTKAKLCAACNRMAAAGLTGVFDFRVDHFGKANNFSRQKIFLFKSAQFTESLILAQNERWRRG